MKKESNRVTGTWGLLLLASVVSALWCYSRLSTARARALDRAEELQRCRQITAEIERLAARPERAAAREMQQPELTGRIEEAARKVGIGADKIVRIEPEPSRRIGGSAYKEKPTRLELQRVTLAELLRFLHTLTAEAESLGVKDLRLQAPHGEEVGDRWRAEVTLSDLLYAPEVKGTS